MSTYPITCSGPGPHNPADGVLGSSDTPQSADVRCASGACVKPVDITVQNQQTLQVKATAALTANAADITQNGNIATQAAAVTATTGSLTTAQLSNYVRQLAQAVTILAGNDTNAKKQLTTIIRLMLNALDSVDGT